MLFATRLIKIIAIWTICCSIDTSEAYSTCVEWTKVEDYNNCITKVLESWGPDLAKGISDLNLPPLDPFYYPNIDLKYNSPLFSVRLNISNYQIFNATKYTVQSVNVNPYNLTVDVRVKIPNIITQTDYNVKGKLLSLNVTGIGKFIGNHTNVTLTLIAKGRNETDENNVERVALDKVKIRLHVGSVKVKMSSTTPKFKPVAKTTQDLINSFSDVILKIANPLIEEIGDFIAKDLMRLFLSAFRRQELIPTPNIEGQQ